MAFRACFRKLTVASTRASAPMRSFHTTPRAFIKVGDEVPNFGGLMENSPGNTVNLAETFKSSDGYIIGLPGAFTPTCSSSHIPSFINHPKLKEAGQVFVVSVNDPFVMKAWAEQLDPTGKSRIRFLADTTVDLTKALGMDYDIAALGGTRSKRYALKVEKGKVTEIHVEPDSSIATVTMAENVLGKA